VKNFIVKVLMRRMKWLEKQTSRKKEKKSKKDVDILDGDMLLSKSPLGEGRAMK